MHAVTTVDADGWVSAEHGGMYEGHTAADAVAARMSRLRNARADALVTGTFITFRLDHGPLGPSTATMTFTDLP